MATTTFKALQVECPGCGRQETVDVQLLGRKTACSLCREVIRVPGSDPAPFRAATPPTVRRDLEAEAHLVALAIWQRISCLACVVFAFGTFMALATTGSAPAALVLAALAIPLAFAVVCGLLGFYLMKYDNVARVITAAMSGLGILWTVGGDPSLASVIPLGYHAAAMIVLLGSRSAALCTNEYQQRVACTPEQAVPWARSPFFYVPVLLIVLALAFAVAAPG
jgi:hypothetical protein